MGRVAFQMIDYAGLCSSEGDPILGCVLQLEKEGFGTLQCLIVQIFPTLKLDLESELADERAMITSRSPQRNVGNYVGAGAEVQCANVLQNLLHDGVPDQVDLFPGHAFYGRKRGQHVNDGLEALVFAFFERTQSELHIVREQGSHSAEAVF